MSNFGNFFRFWSLFHDHTPRSSFFRFFLILIVILVLLVFVFVPGAAGQGFPGNPVPVEVAANVKYFYKIPWPVSETLKNSVVGVRASWSSFAENGDLVVSSPEATGVVVAEGMVLTSFHILPNFADVQFFQKAVKFKVYDGLNFFEAEMIGLDSENDLILLGVVAFGNGSSFTKTPAVLASVEEKKEFLESADNFYAFRFISSGPELFFPIKLGPYWGETNLVGDQQTSARFGFVGGWATKGFSGGPLVGTDGKVYGLLSRMAAPYVYVTTVDAIAHFNEVVLAEVDKEKVEKEKQGKMQQNKK